MERGVIIILLFVEITSYHKLIYSCLAQYYVRVQLFPIIIHKYYPNWLCISKNVIRNSSNINSNQKDKKKQKRNVSSFMSHFCLSFQTVQKNKQRIGQKLHAHLSTHHNIFCTCYCTNGQFHVRSDSVRISIYSGAVTVWYIYVYFCIQEKRNKGN